MKKLVILFFVFIISNFSAEAQIKLLSLDDAVMKQRTVLGPKNIVGLQFMHEKDGISYISEDRMSIQKSDKDHLISTMITLNEINSIFGIELKSAPYPIWKDISSFYFNYNNNYYELNYKNKSGNLMYKLPIEAQNIDLHKESGSIAYTIGRNLFIQKKQTDPIKISNIDETIDVICGQTIARSEFGISKGTFWSPSADILAFYQKNETDVADYPLLDITQTPGRLNSIKYPMAGQKSEHAQVGIYNVKTGRTVYLQVDGEKDQYLTNLSWDPTEKFIYVVIVNRAQNHIWFKKYNAEDGRFIKTLFEEEHPKYVEPEHPAWFFPNRKNEFIWLSERDGFMHMYHYDTDGKFLGQLSRGNWVVESILGLDEMEKNIIVSGTDSSGLNLHAYSIELKSGKLKNLTQISGYHNVALHPKGSMLLDNFSNVSTPRIIRIIDTYTGKEVKRMLEAENPLKNHQVGKVELHTITANDGTALHARLIKPSNFDSLKKYPVLLYVYGGPHAQMITNSWLGGSQLWMQYFAEKGFLVFTLDNRGSKSRGFNFENVIHRQLGKIEMEDQIKGIEWLKNLGFVDSTRMAVHGWSFGGFMTISLMLKYPDVFKAAVAGGSVTDWKFYEAMYGERYMDRPEENPSGYESARLNNYVSNLKGKLMLIHGTADDVVLEQHSLNLIKSFIENGKMVDYFPYPMHPHNVLGKDRVHLMQKVLNYIEENLK
jgi:dipeptidyl-peptidase-4